MRELEASPAVGQPRPGSRVRALLDGDGDIWVSWDGGETYRYIVPQGWGVALDDLLMSGTARHAVWGKPDAAGAFIDHWAICAPCQDGLPCSVGDPLWYAMRGNDNARQS